jgi:hypothetical protein
MAKLILKTPYYKPGHKTEKGQSRGGYAEYIAKREGVEVLRSGYASYIGERRGSHGMFSDEGEEINLSKISAEIDNHTTKCSFSNYPRVCAEVNFSDSSGATSTSQAEY